MATGRRKGWLIGLGVPVALVVAVVSLWRWDWFIPLLESRASVALGRPVRIGHLHVALGNPLRVTATDVAVANPPGWQGAPFAQVKRLVVDVAAWDYVRRGALVIPLVEADQPAVRLSQLPNGSDNYGFRLSGGPGGPSPRIGEVRISRGEVYAALARLRADFKIDVATREEGGKAQIVAAARGTYGGAPITAQATGGAPLSLRDAAEPWPVDLRLENGPTRAALAGTLRDPLRLTGADLKVQLSGQDMSQLEALTGIAIPRTPPFRLTGGLDFANQRVRLRDLRGQVGNSGLEGTLEADPWKERPEVRVELQVGNSDLEGTLEADPWKERPEVRVDLRSRQVNLVDLGGFVGAAPGPAASAAAGPRATLLSDTPISVPRLRWADVHLRYRAQRIQGRSVPLDNLAVALDIENGQATLHPLSLGVGKGRIKASLALTPRGDKSVRARADIEFQRVDVSRLMGATQSFHGAGTVSGTGTLDATGDSLAALLANGDGGIRLGMTGGDLSAQLVNLSGLQFGSAVLSALGLPQRAPVKCFVADLPLRQGILTLQALVLDTAEGIVNGAGTVNLRDESLALRLRTEATHFSIGSLPAPIHIGGTLRHPRIVPGAELAARGGIAAALGVVFPPLALLPDHPARRGRRASLRPPAGRGAAEAGWRAAAEPRGRGEHAVAHRNGLPGQGLAGSPSVPRHGRRDQETKRGRRGRGNRARDGVERPAEGPPHVPPAPAERLLPRYWPRGARARCECGNRPTLGTVTSPWRGAHPHRRLRVPTRTTRSLLLSLLLWMWRCILPGGTGRSEEARGMRSGPKPHLAIAALGGALAAAACAVVPPTGPTVVALPPRGKSLAAFQREDAGCRGYAGAAIASDAAASEYSLQTRYNTAYTQCMYARGNTVRAPPLDAGAGYPAYAGPYPYPSPWYGSGLYPWYGGGLFGSDIIVLGGGGRHFHDGFPGGGSATGGPGSWRSGGSQGGPATGGSTPWRR